AVHALGRCGWCACVVPSMYLHPNGRTSKVAKTLPIGPSGAERTASPTGHGGTERLFARYAIQRYAKWRNNHGFPPIAQGSSRKRARETCKVAETRSSPMIAAAKPKLGPLSRRFLGGAVSIFFRVAIALALIAATIFVCFRLIPVNATTAGFA